MMSIVTSSVSSFSHPAKDDFWRQLDGLEKQLSFCFAFLFPLSFRLHTKAMALRRLSGIL
jgi:hypothetical protein